ncbi:[FeFe] hydrogenase H-cluster radical SAM maturase HydG [Candidatus Micrarchaeota archaeon]|nr:[FeFe] hydrogenase H-cluster radical SAM maturase HydG [Candidatus Micrarchaeota archaeon]
MIVAGFIDEEEINKAIEDSAEPSEETVEKALEKAARAEGLSLNEAAALLSTENAEMEERIFSAAREVKKKIYGSRLVLFAPLYLSNYCANNCLYCGFRRDNTELKRKCLNTDEIRSEVGALLDSGHKRLLLVAGEHPAFSNIDYLENAINTVYSVRRGNSEIRRVNVNAAPMGVEDFRRLKQAGIGTYQLFQETYHLETYKRMHTSGPKADYFKRLEAIDAAMAAGIDDIGIGALFGLYDYKFEALSLLAHARHMEEKHDGVGPHTISVPRIEPALNAPAAAKPPSPVSDEEFKRIVAVLRLAVPYTGIILSTREGAEMRNEVFSLGVSQISGGSRTNPGGYSENKRRTDPYGGAVEPGSRTNPGGYAENNRNPLDEAQFALNDNRTLEELVKDVCGLGFLPSFCTSCYRSSRTGDRFMKLAKTGEIQKFCLPNAILTFQEYLEDYASPELKEIGGKVIAREMQNIPDPKRREAALLKLKEVKEGKRDRYF